MKAVRTTSRVYVPARTLQGHNTRPEINGQQFKDLRSENQRRFNEALSLQLQVRGHAVPVSVHRTVRVPVRRVLRPRNLLSDVREIFEEWFSSVPSTSP